jgi:hypothetical protein
LQKTSGVIPKLGKIYRRMLLPRVQGSDATGSAERFVRKLPDGARRIAMGQQAENSSRLYSADVGSCAR